MLAVVSGSAAVIDERPFDPKPWLEDLAQMRQAFSEKYANLEWAVFDRQIDLTGLFSDAKNRVEGAGNDAEARAAFDRLIRQIGDGHVQLQWPKSRVTDLTKMVNPCAGYNSSNGGPLVAALVPGYVALETPQSATFPAGVITLGRRRVGVLKIKSFDPSATPGLCQGALAALSIQADASCDDDCSERIDAWAQTRMNQEFIDQLEALKATKIDALLVDILGNGGGTEWASAAARMLTPIRLKSSAYRFMRGPHWEKTFGDLEDNLRKAALSARPEDRVLLLKFASQAAKSKLDAARHCDAAPFWEGKRPTCNFLGEGPVFMHSPDPNTLRGKPWAQLIFSPMKYQFSEGVWRGPLIILVDSGTASASEGFAAELQDNHAALIMGEHTYGAGLGYTEGGNPTTLKNTKAVLQLPDCVGLRADGSSTIRGVVPDLLVGFHRMDGPRLKALAVFAALPEALDRVVARAK
jgi:hypothetical protein